MFLLYVPDFDGAQPIQNQLANAEIIRGDTAVNFVPLSQALTSNFVIAQLQAEMASVLPPYN